MRWLETVAITPLYKPLSFPPEKLGNKAAPHHTIPHHTSMHTGCSLSLYYTYICLSLCTAVSLESVPPSLCLSNLTFVSAMTFALLGSAVSSALSPKHEYSSMRRSLLSRPPDLLLCVTEARPSFKMKKVSPTSPCGVRCDGMRDSMTFESHERGRNGVNTRWKRGCARAKKINQVAERRQRWKAASRSLGTS